MERKRIAWRCWMAVALVLGLVVPSGCSYLSAKSTYRTPVFNQNQQMVVDQTGQPVTIPQELTDEAAYYQAQIAGAQLASQPIFRFTFPDPAKASTMQEMLANPSKAPSTGLGGLLAGATLEVRSPHNGQITQYRSEWANWIPVIAMGALGAYTTNQLANVAVAGFGAARGTINTVTASQQAGIQQGSPSGQVSVPQSTTSTDNHSTGTGAQ